MERLFLLLFVSGTLGLDPCDDYKVLDNAWRATTNRFYSPLMCDQNVQWLGWYRLYLNGQSAQMSETCLIDNSCGTHAPLWINGPHPRVEDGVVSREVCGNWNSNCCYFKSTAINVKACPGSYYIYEFKSPTGCYLAYCATTDYCFNLCGPNANCTENDSCSCKSGYEVTNVKEIISSYNPCIDVNECLASPSICGPNSNCTNKNGGYSCSCLEGFVAIFPDLPISINNACTAFKRQVVRMEVKSGQNVNDPAVMEYVLQWIKEKLKDHGIEKDTTLAWRMQPEGKVFLVKRVTVKFLQKCDKWASVN